MVELFDDYPHNPPRALQIWGILVSKASNWQTVRYGVLAELIGYGAAGPLGGPLDHIAYFCRNNALPPLTVLAVNRETGIPGEGFFIVHPDVDPNAAREQVFDFDWFSVFPPTPDQLHDAYQAG